MNKNIIIKLLLSSAIFFVLLTLIELLFKYFKILDTDKSTVSDIIRIAIISTVLWFFFMFFWIKRRLKKQNQQIH